MEPNVLDILLDEDNDDPITLYDEKDNPVKFDQVAIIPIEDKLYAVLKPIDKIDGVADDEVVIFYINEENADDVFLVAENDTAVANKVFDEYTRLVDEAENAEKEQHEKDKKTNK